MLYTVTCPSFYPHVYSWLGVIVYLVFLFLVIVVLLNLLIAQMSDTYASVQQDAQRSLAINRAWIVARVEHNSLTVLLGLVSWPHARVQLVCKTLILHKNHNVFMCAVNAWGVCLAYCPQDYRKKFYRSCEIVTNPVGKGLKSVVIMVIILSLPMQRCWSSGRCLPSRRSVDRWRGSREPCTNMRKPLMS